jgi:hypothetical protein
MLRFRQIPRAITSRRTPTDAVDDPNAFDACVGSLAVAMGVFTLTSLINQEDFPAIERTIRHL